MNENEFRGNGFKKFDAGKPMASEIPPRALLDVAKVLTIGAERYGRRNWMLNKEPNRYEDALARHWLAYLSGEIVDPDSGLPHLAHLATNALFLLELYKLNQPVKPDSTPER